eukprot:scaffold210059_cov31-Prasinocladus_malaysianus.AAC.1
MEIGDRLVQPPDHEQPGNRDTCEDAGRMDTPQEAQQTVKPGTAVEASRPVTAATQQLSSEKSAAASGREGGDNLELLLAI